MSGLENIVSGELVERVGWTLVHFVWQGCAVAAALAVVLLCLRKRSANIRYVVSCVALVAMVTAPIVTIWRMERPERGEAVSPTVPVENVAPMEPREQSPVVGFAPLEEAIAPAEPVVVRKIERPATAVAEVGLKERFVSRVESSLPLLVVGWIAGVAGLSLWYLGGWTQLQRMRRRMVRPVGTELREKLARIAERVGVTRAVELMESALVSVPVVIGWLKPVILLPASAVTGLDAEQLEALLAHELAHIKRCDYLVNILQTIVEILGFYHPAVWWVSHRIRIEREMCCDDVAVAVCGDSVRYAKALASIAESHGLGGNLAVAASGGSLLERVRRLVLKESAHKEKANWGAVVVAVLLVAAILVPAGVAVSARLAEREDVDDYKDVGKEAERSESQFEYTLSNGVTVELVGLCSGLDGEERVWWRADGSIASADEFEAYAQYVKPRPVDGYEWKYAYLVKVTPAADTSVDTGVSVGTCWHRGSTPDKAVRIGCVYWDSAYADDFPAKGGIKVATGAGEWEQFESKVNDGTLEDMRTVADKTVNVFVSGPRQYIFPEPMIDVTLTSNEYEIMVSYELANGEVKAARWDGRAESPGITSFNQKENPLVGWSFRVDDNWQEIEKFIIKYRKYEVVTFENVSLRAGERTEVEVRSREKDGREDEAFLNHLGVVAEGASEQSARRERRLRPRGEGREGQDRGGEEGFSEFLRAMNGPSDAGSEEFAVSLPNGTRVELVGVLRLGDEGIEAWRADGTPTKIEGVLESDIAGFEPVLALKFSGEVAGYELLLWNWGKPQWLNMMARDGLEDFRFYTLEPLGEPRRYATLIVRELECGPRKMVLSLPLTKSELESGLGETKFKETYGIDIEYWDRTGSYRRLGNQEKFGIHIRFDEDRPEGVLVAIDKSGEYHQHTSQRISGVSGIFKLDPNDLAGFAYIDRDKAEVKFRNISLVAGQGAEVVVESEFFPVEGVEERGESGAEETGVEKRVSEVKEGRSTIIIAKDGKAELGGGVTVELAGLCANPADSNQWWDCNGRPIAAPEFKAYYIVWNAPPGGLKLECAALLRFSETEKKKIPNVRLAQRELSAGSISPIAQDGTAIINVVSLAGEPRISEVGTITVGLGASEWKAAAGLGKYVPNQHTIYLLDDGSKFVMHPLRPERALAYPAMVVDISGNFAGYEFRLVCKSKSGETVECPQIGSTGDLAAYWQVNVPEEDIEDFVLEYRKYEWAEFRNVPLRRAERTDADVDEENVGGYGGVTVEAKEKCCKGERVRVMWRDEC